MRQPQTPTTDRQRADLVGLLGSLADPIRCRMLAVLADHELSVSELCATLDLPQSTVSRHLKVLVDAGWLGSRRDGTSHFYRLEIATLANASRGVWDAVQPAAAALGGEHGDEVRLEGVLAARRGMSKAFFATGAAGWDQLRDELFGASVELVALPALLDRNLVVADLACGTGRVAAAVAPWVARVFAVDESPAMLAAARRILNGLPTAELREGMLENLPIGDGAVDIATLVLALHHVAEPEQVLGEARRILRPGGRLLVVDMLPHDHEVLRRDFGHVWLGFDRERLARFGATSGLDLCDFRPVEPRGSGPSLFVAVFTRPAVPVP